MVNIPLNVNNTFLLAPLTVDGYLACFYHLDIGNNAFIGLYVQAVFEYFSGYFLVFVVYIQTWNA
jgi:hypothetical protein